MGAINQQKAGQTAAAPDPAQVVDRAAVNKLGLAMLRVYVPSSGVHDLLLGKSIAGPRVTYIAPASNRTLVLYGQLVASTHGLGTDLNPIFISDSDPIANPRPLAQWPATTTRAYNIAPKGPVATFESFDCRYENNGAETVDILGSAFNTVKMRETCVSKNRSFANIYNVDARGQVWKSAQWTGPVQGYVRVETLEPLD